MDPVLENVDPRVHFAHNCASNSCPPIGVYSAESLNAQLDLASRNFIQGDLLIDKESHTITILKIFRWYQVDFGGREGILDCTFDHISDQERTTWIRNHRKIIRMKYHPYDWGLNRLEP
jgi:hypothetical protein